MAFNREKALTAAAKFVAKGQHDRAAKEYVALIEADPTDTRSWLLLAEALTNAGDKPGAIERYLHVAEGYAASNEAQKAIAVYRKVLGLDPNRLDIQTRIASLYKDLGRTGDAVAAYEFVAQAYFQAGLIAEGLEGFRMVAELEPAAVGKRLRLAELYSREGMVAQAVEHFRLAADRLLADRRTDDYIRVAERLIYHKEDDLPVLRSLAQIYLKQGENRRALVKLNALLRAAPADAEGLELLGETFVAIGKVDKAISVVMELAREQRKGGRKNKETAARVLRKALAWNPENADDIRKIAGEIEAEIAALPPDPEPKDGAPREARDEGMDLEVDVVEDAGGGDLDIDVDVEEEEERKVEEVPSRPFAPVGANVAPSVVEDGEEDVGDVEKILLEARVYVKYKMFEHALGHLDSVFVRDANHIAGLDLQAQILIELGRKAEAADSLVRLAQLVSDRDPKLARQHLEQAQKLVPDHTKAEMVLAALESGDSGGTGETAPLVRGLQADLKGDPASKPDPEPPPVDSDTPTSEPPTDAASDSDAEVEPETETKPTDASSPDLTDAKTGEWRAATPEPGDATSAAASETRREAAGETKPAAASEATGETKPAAAPEAASDTKSAVAPEAASDTKPEAASAPESAGTAAEPATTPESTPSEPALARRFVDPAAPASEGSGARQLPTERTPLPISPLLTRFGEKTPLPKTPLPTRFSEKTPLPTFKPPPPADPAARSASDADEPSPTDSKPDTIEDGSSAEATPAEATGDRTETAEKPVEKPAPPPARAIIVKPRKPPTPATPAPTQPSPEVEELDAGVIEELDVDDVAEELVVETPTPPPPRKGPPSRPKPPAKRPPAAPKAKPRAPSEDSKAEPAPEDSKATAAPEDSKATTVPEDSKAEPVPEDSKAKPVPEDSKAKPVPEDSKATAPEDSKAKPVPEDSKSEPVSTDSKSTAPEASKPDDVTATPGEPTAPADAKPATTATDAKPTDAPPSSDAEPAAPTAAQTRPGPAAETTAPPKPDAAATEPAPATPTTATEPTAAKPGGPNPGDTAALAIDAVLAAELELDPGPKSITDWPDIADELDELRFFISSRFEDDAQFAYLDLQRRFPGHPALAEFADRFSTRLESAAAPVMLEDPRTPSAAMRAAVPVKSMFEDEDEDNFLASIFDEPASKAPGKSAKPRRAVATLDDGADAQTFFDLGTAYREMGLDDDALGQFELAAKDPRWTARARIMSASLRVSRGEHEQALRDLDFAIEFATDEDQRSEAGYELGVLYQTLGDKTRAIEALETVAPGYRDRDERLKTLTR